MNNLWQLQEAKNKFSQVVDRAIHSGPQTITRHGEKTVVILAVEEYQKLQGREGTLVEFLRQSPLVGSNLSITRSKDTGRDVDL